MNLLLIHIGYGFIDFATEEDAINALNGYNGRPIRKDLCYTFIYSWNRFYVPP